MNDNQPAMKEAREWLDRWAAIGGGVTIAASGTLHPWRIGGARLLFGGRPITAQQAAEKAEALLCQLVGQPELHQPIRVILNTVARKMAAPMLKSIEGKDE